MIASLRGKLAAAFGRRPKERPNYAVPDGRIVYAVGDVHGRRDLLDRLLTQIESHAARHPRDWVRRIVFLGDYIDRGPDSAGVIERLLAPPPEGCSVTFLCGNHEQAMLDFFDSAAPSPAWLRHGGVSALASYGISAAGPSIFEVRDAMREKIPQPHIDFLRGLENHTTEGDYLFVHAGIRPGVPLERQTPQDFQWIREPFLSDGTAHPFKVIHGHTISDIPDIRPNRIGIDTGAYASGVLTALALWQNRMDFLQTA